MARPWSAGHARAPARRLGIPFYVANVEARFAERVVAPFVEDYVDGATSDCIHMLFSGEEARGVDDMGAYAATRPVLHEPGTVWSYSSGTTNIVCRILGDTIAGGGVEAVGSEQRRTSMLRFMQERLFGPAGMPSAMKGP